jgi:acetyl esterase
MPATDPRWDPEMLAFQTWAETEAAKLPPIRLEPPMDEARLINDAIGLRLAQGGAAMAESTDRWLPVRGRRLLCRFHRPAGAAGVLPVLVYLHGGGWVWGSVDTHDRVMREYAAKAGCAVVGVDYALSPEATFPQALEECAAVIHWLAAHGAEWDLDPSRITVGGDSAGANLAMGAALLLRETDRALRLTGLLLHYGVFDADTDTPSYREFADGYFLTREKMRFYWRCYAPREADRLNPLACPLRADLRGLPPVFLHAAELDVLASENHAMAVRLREAGVPVEFEVLQGAAHGCIRALGQVGVARWSVERAAEWLARSGRSG